MKKFTSLGLAILLVALMGFGVGCTKKELDSNAGTGGPIGVTPIQIAAQTITDGVVYFDFDRYDIKPEYTAMLRQKADLMREYPTIRVRIEGNCDERGTQEYNLALGERRAKAAYDYMVMSGVNPSQLEMISYGKERPAVMGSGEQVWNLNRRDDFRVIAQ